MNIIYLPTKQEECAPIDSNVVSSLSRFSVIKNLEIHLPMHGGEIAMCMKAFGHWRAKRQKALSLLFTIPTLQRVRYFYSWDGSLWQKWYARSKAVAEVGDMIFEEGTM
jgi:hypothetical protein